MRVITVSLPVALLLSLAYLPGLARADSSSCQICRDSGNCTVAYQGTPGKYCGAWLDRVGQRQACCCPSEAVCSLSNYACNCKNAPLKEGGYGHLIYILVGLIFIALIAGVAFAVWKRRAGQTTNAYGENAAYAQHAPAYATAPPPGYAGASGYAPAYGPGGAYGPNAGMNNRGGMSTGVAVGAGLAAGLAGGYLIDQALDGGDHGIQGGGGGGNDNGGDFGGDFAGDF